MVEAYVAVSVGYIIKLLLSPVVLYNCLVSHHEIPHPELDPSKIKVRRTALLEHVLHFCFSEVAKDGNFPYKQIKFSSLPSISFLAQGNNVALISFFARVQPFILLTRASSPSFAVLFLALSHSNLEHTQDVLPVFEL